MAEVDRLRMEVARLTRLHGKDSDEVRRARQDYLVGRVRLEVVPTVTSWSDELDEEHRGQVADLLRDVADEVAGTPP